MIIIIGCNFIGEQGADLFGEALAINHSLVQLDIRT